MAPHPKFGYRDESNKRVPGTTTIIGRFKDSGGLLYWACEQGKAIERGEISKLYDKRDTDRVPKWLFWLMRPSLTVIAGRTFISHDPRFAAKLSENAIAHAPAGFARHRLHLKAGLAKAKLALGEVDEAVSHASEVLPGIADNSMPRVEKLISEFNAQLPNDPVTLDFKERFAAYKRTLIA